MIGYLQHKAGPNGPFRTESVKVQETRGAYRAFFEGIWRRVFDNENGTYIRFQNERITIQIEEQK